MKNNKKIQSQIDKLQALVDMDSIPQSDRDDAAAKIEELKAKLSSSGPKGSAKKNSGEAEDSSSGKTPKKAGKKKSSKKAAGKKSPSKDPDDDCAEEIQKLKSKIKANKKPRKEPVQHTRETRVVNALKTLQNVLLEGHEDDTAMVTKIGNFITRIEIRCKEDFIGLKRVKHSPELQDKIDDVKAAA